MFIVFPLPSQPEQQQQEQYHIAFILQNHDAFTPTMCSIHVPVSLCVCTIIQFTCIYASVNVCLQLGGFILNLFSSNILINDHIQLLLVSLDARVAGTRPAAN